MTKVVKLTVAGLITVGAFALACMPGKKTLGEKVQEFAESVEQAAEKVEEVAEKADAAVESAGKPAKEEK